MLLTQIFFISNHYNPKTYMKILVAIAALFSCASSFALDPNHFTITRITAPYFIVDGNSPATITSAFVGFEVKNNSNSAVTYSGLKFTVTSITTSVTGQDYSIASPASGVVNIGTLAPGQSKVCYYYVHYPASVTPIGTFNVSLTDNTPNAKNTSFNIRNRSSISANAGGAATQNFTNQDIVGGIVTDDVTYTVGNVQNGDESDFQVAVSPQFDPTKIVLINTKVTASTVPGISVGTTDSLYFITGNGSNGASVTIRWTFRIAASNFTTYLLPCAGATSGSTNYKYALNTNLGQGSPVTMSSNANPLTITKTSDQSVYAYNSNALFTVKICNPGAYDVTIDKITDELPAGFTYQGLSGTGDVTSSNSTTTPAVGSSGTITFEGGVTAGAQTSYHIPSGGCINLSYNATAPSTQASNLASRARYYVMGNMIDSGQNTVSVSAPLAVDWIKFYGQFSGNKLETLNWRVQETNVSTYEIEKKSHNASAFKSIGIVNSKGDGLHDYQFTATNTAEGKSFYRIKQVHINGTFKYSPVISLTIPSTQGMAVYPNPVQNVLTISLNTVGVKISLADINGKILQRFTSKQKISTLVMNSYSKGVYILNINDKPAQKIIKE